MVEASVHILNMVACVTIVVWLLVVHVADLTSMERIVVNLVIWLLNQEVVELLVMHVLVLKFIMLLNFVLIVVELRGFERVVDLVLVEMHWLDIMLVIVAVVKRVVRLVINLVSSHAVLHRLCMFTLLSRLLFFRLRLLLQIKNGLMLLLELSLLRSGGLQVS